MSNYGLNIINTSGRFISNGATPLLTDVGTFATTIIPGTTGSPVLGYYGVWAASPNITVASSPLPLVRCSGGMTAPYCVTDGYAAIITSSPSGESMNVCSPITTKPRASGQYGIESYDESGNLLFSSAYTFPDIIDVVSVPLSSMDNAVRTGVPINISHAYVDDPHYIISGLNTYYVYWWAYWWNYGSYYYSSTYTVSKVAVMKTSNSSIRFGLAAIGNYTVDPYPNNQSIGYAAMFEAKSIVSNFGGMTKIYYIEWLDGTAGESIDRWSSLENLTVLVCRKRN